MNLFKMELISLTVEKKGNEYYGKGTAKLGIAEVNVEARRGYGGFKISVNDGSGKVANLDDLKRMGFSVDVSAIEAEFDKKVKVFQAAEADRKRIERETHYDLHPIRAIKREMEKKSFICEITPNKEEYAKSFSDHLKLSLHKLGAGVNIGVGINFDDGRFEVMADNEYNEIKKTSRWQKAVILAELAWTRKKNQIEEKKIFADSFEVERLRLQKELGISVAKTRQAYSTGHGRNQKWVEYDAYLIEVPFGDKKSSIIFVSHKDGILIKQVSERIPQTALSGLINGIAGKTLANEIPVKDPEPFKGGARKLNPIV